MNWMKDSFSCLPDKPHRFVFLSYSSNPLSKRDPSSGPKFSHPLENPRIPYRETSDSNNRRHERDFCDVFKICDLHRVEFVGRYRASFKQSLDELSRGCSFPIWPTENVLRHVSGIFGAVYSFNRFKIWRTWD